MMISKLLHLKGLHYKINMFLVNYVYVGAKRFEKKRKLLNAIGFQIGEGTKIVGPIYCTGKLVVGKKCWLGKNFNVNGNGNVIIGDNCDIAPDVTCQTGTHCIGGSERRAGEGHNGTITIGDGSWIGVRVTILPDVNIGCSCVIAACACVVKSVDANQLFGGVPAKKIKDI